MCIVAVGWRAFADASAVLWSNRDEFLSRPTVALSRWSDHPNIAAGRDLQEGGTWLGVASGGRFAAVTNFRDPAERLDNPLSRGTLPVAFLAGACSPESFIESIRPTCFRYRGFLLLIGDESSALIFESRFDRVTYLTQGVTAFSNGALANSWPKCSRLAGAMREQASRGVHIDESFDALADRTQANALDLPKTGVAPNVEAALSSVFVMPAAIFAKPYQTRASTVAIFESGTWQVHERRFGVNSATAQTPQSSLLLA